MTRRRVLRIAAGAAGFALCGGSRIAGSAPAPGVHTWRGIVLGAGASITLCHRDRAKARELLFMCVSEIERLENAFSLYRSDSEITRLNRNGLLDRPSLDLVQLLSRAQAFAGVTKGAFDATIQPLWNLYARHFQDGGSRDHGPDARSIEEVLSRIDYRMVVVSASRVELERHGMGVTLNGIAQGYITDRVADILRNEGFDDVLVNLGEIRGLGRRVDGRPWTVGLDDPVRAVGTPDTLSLDDAAIASSAGSATRFDESGRHHHLFDPRTGTSTNRYRKVTVIAPNATTADALSTGFASLELGQVREVLRHFPSVTARMSYANADVVTLSG